MMSSLLSTKTSFFFWHLGEREAMKVARLRFVLVYVVYGPRCIGVLSATMTVDE
jgi:hypothetical protein